MSLQDENIRLLSEGEIQWIDVEFPSDPDWDKNVSYADQLKKYYSMYRFTMPKVPKVPKLLTYCDFTKTDESNIDHAVRINDRSIVLQPRKWMVELDTEGLDPLVGDECEGQFKITKDVHRVLS